MYRCLSLGPGGETPLESAHFLRRLRLEVDWLDPLLQVYGFIGKTRIGEASGVLCAQDHSMLLGHLEVYDFAHQRWDLRRLFDLRGQVNLRRRGLGARLLQSFLEEAKSRGARSVHGSVTHGAILATPGVIEFYERRGFRRLPAGPQEILGALCRIEYVFGPSER